MERTQALNRSNYAVHLPMLRIRSIKEWRLYKGLMKMKVSCHDIELLLKLHRRSIPWFNATENVMLFNYSI